MRHDGPNRLGARPARGAPVSRSLRAGPLLILSLILAACGGTPTPPGQAVSVSVSPTTLQLQPGASATIVATVTGASNTAVTWQATGGSIAGSGNTVTYTAPDDEGAFTVTATSAADPSKTATTTVQVSEGSASLDGWVRQFGAHMDDEATGVAVDADDNVIVVGNTPLAMPGGTRIGKRDAYVIKFDADGEQLWVQQIGSLEDDYVYGVAVDGDGSIFVAGHTYGLVGEDGSYVGLIDAFVTKLGPDGALQWTIQFGTTNYDYVSGVAVDAEGNVIVIGQTQGTFPDNSKFSALDAFAAKFDTDGQQLWIRQFGPGAEILTRGVATGPDGSVFIVGDTRVAMPGTTALGDNDAFLVKLAAADGTPEWYRQIGTEESDYAGDVAVDGAGNIIVAGVTEGVMAGDPDTESFDVFVRAYNAAGTVLWTQQFGTARQDSATAVTSDVAGNVYVAGGTRGGAMPGHATPGRDAFVAKLGTDGTIDWIRQIDSNGGEEQASGVAIDGAGNVIISGDTTGTMPGYTKVGGRADNKDGFVYSLLP